MTYKFDRPNKRTIYKYILHKLEDALYIVRFWNKCNTSKSFYIYWSGSGMFIRLFSFSLLWFRTVAHETFCNLGICQSLFFMDSFHESPYYRDCTLYRTVKNGNHLSKFGGLEAILAIRNIQIDMKLKVTKSYNIMNKCHNK